MRHCGRNLYLAPLIVLIASSVDSSADFKVAKTGDSLVDAKALTIQGGFGRSINGVSFQQDAVTTHKQHQYVGYYNAGRHVCLARRKLPSGKWKTVRFKDYDFKSNDSHNTISVGICPNDGTIHLAFDHHGHPLHYRLSRKGAATNPQTVKWDASLFGAVVSELEKGKPIRITYPRFQQTPKGGLQFCYRRGGSGNGDRMLVDYDPETGAWADTRQIDSRKGLFSDDLGKSRSRCSYPNGYDYGPRGRLHATWVWREASQGANHDLMYAYSEDKGKTWLNNRGKKLTGPPSVTSPGVKVVDIGRKYGLMNTHGQAVDSKGRVHVVMWHCSDESLKAAHSKPGEKRWGPPAARRNHHYWRDLKGVWRHTELPGVAGTRPKIFIDGRDNAYVIFSNSWSRGIFYPKGSMLIAAATSRSEWKDWKILHVEKGPFGNEMIMDFHRWKQDGILSVMAQGSPEKAHAPTPLRILDFTVEQ
ncbi:MAG: BNR repeat-containing protein [Phycisphaerae bacterium]|jgi:hypothetical protein|nr:BNR repeat-containing protein [Phycisphaerae bacterium]